MAEAPSVEELALRLIAQCRREIEAGWAQIEAARDTLRQTRWMVARWREQRRMYEGPEGAPPIAPGKTSHAGTYTMVRDARGRPIRTNRRDALNRHSS
jgi:hypothetical protein